MELIQTIHHIGTGRYLSFLRPWFYRLDKLFLLGGIFDIQLLKTAGRYFISVIRNPKILFERLSIQVVVILQPHDILASGEPTQRISLSQIILALLASGPTNCLAVSAPRFRFNRAESFCLGMIVIITGC